VVVGNGLGADPALSPDVVAVATSAGGPAVVVDADGLRLLADVGPGPGGLSDRVVLTPHDGEFAALAGQPPGPDRIAAARWLAAERGAVVLLKGPTTVVAHPDGTVALSTAGDERLATAGTGDVLAGVVAALCARGAPPFAAAAMGAYLHGRAAALGWRDGLVASDLIDLLPAALAAVGGSGADQSRRPAQPRPAQPRPYRYRSTQE
jgi:NAD(P)H-hydrate epimerase